MTATSTALKQIYSAARPLIADGLDIAEQIAALRDTATNAGLDWSQIKALLKAQIQDERDENGDGKRVKRLLEKADHATAYADMLGLANMNENNFSAEDVGGDDPFPPHDPVTGEITETQSTAGDGLSSSSGAAGESDAAAAMSAASPAAPIPEQESGVLSTGDGEPLTDETTDAVPDSFCHNSPVKSVDLTDLIPETPQDDPPVPSLAGEAADVLAGASAADPEFDIGNIPEFLKRTPASDARAA